MRLRAWLELARISNAPTVVSNALTGCALGAAAEAVFPWRAAAIAAPALVLVYVGGMAMNDAADARTDRAERPGRAIPSGRISPGAAWAFVVIVMTAAVILLAAAGWHAVGAGAALVACVAAYNLSHRLHPATVVLMAGCRALAVITAATAAGWWFGAETSPRVVGVAAGLWAYVVALSLVARAEAGRPARTRMVVAMVCAISLIDAGVLAALGRWAPAAIAGACFLLAAWGQRRILGS